MIDMFGGYDPLTAMQTTGSGSARWCLVRSGTKRFFLKEFLAPVWPVRTNTPIGQKQLERCLRFEDKKQHLYTALSCVMGDVLIPVVDFFRENGHYYAVTEAVPDGHITADRAFRLQDDEKKQVLYELAVGLQRLHMQGIVHADLKPEHILLFPHGHGWKPKIIDLDSGFLIDDPPCSQHQVEGDPAYLAPETFLYMIGEATPPGIAADTFAFAAIIHLIWTGGLPAFDRDRYHYLYEAALDEGEIKLELPKKWQETVRDMLNARPEKRPSDAQIASMFLSERLHPGAAKQSNSLTGLMKG